MSWQLSGTVLQIRFASTSGSVEFKPVIDTNNNGLIDVSDETVNPTIRLVDGSGISFDPSNLNVGEYVIVSDSLDYEYSDVITTVVIRQSTTRFANTGPIPLMFSIKVKKDAPIENDGMTQDVVNPPIENESPLVIEPIPPIENDLPTSSDPPTLVDPPIEPNSPSDPPIEPNLPNVVDPPIESDPPIEPDLPSGDLLSDSLVSQPQPTNDSDEDEPPMQPSSEPENQLPPSEPDTFGATLLSVIIGGFALLGGALAVSKP